MDNVKREIACENVWNDFHNNAPYNTDSEYYAAIENALDTCTIIRNIKFN